jgi:hypothetical protein
MSEVIPGDGVIVSIRPAVYALGAEAGPVGEVSG